MVKTGFSIPIGSNIDSWPIVDSGIVYFGADDGNFYAYDINTIDPETGKCVMVDGWPYPTGDAIRGGIALHETLTEKYVIVGSDLGKVDGFQIE